MSKTMKGWRPEGKTPDKILASILAEATSLINEFDKIAARHANEREIFRAANPWNIGGKDFEQWKKERLLKNLFEIASPEEFDYDFHERRRTFLEQVETGADLDLGSTFIDVCLLAGIQPLLVTILNVHEARRHIYRAPDPHSAPEFDTGSFDLLEFDITLLRMFVDASKFYGENQLLAILMQRYDRQ